MLMKTANQFVNASIACDTVNTSKISYSLYFIPYNQFYLYQRKLHVYDQVTLNSTIIHVVK